MATAQLEARLKAGGAQPRNTRRNEIVAIALFALSALMTLCLVSYNPNDASWVSAGASEARNWTGRVGANVAAALFQTFGLAAALLPLLMVAAAWRRFRTRRIHAPLSRVIGLTTLTLAASSLLALYVTEPLFDRSFNAGGFVGVLFAESLKGVLNTVGATVMLAAAAAVGLLALTHLSSRYFGPEIAREAREVFPETVVPKDFDIIDVRFQERGGPQLIKGGAAPRREPATVGTREVVQAVEEGPG